MPRRECCEHGIPMDEPCHECDAIMDAEGDLEDADEDEDDLEDEDDEDFEDFEDMEG
jgi:hypothetical protein